ncbi:MAG: ribonuclease III [Candidatus Krumholzibacteria bacterium]|nr:ribonuclease III [Candidatus Krumholzibacteria bacterium]
MGLKDSIQQVLSRLAGGSPASDPVPDVLDDREIDESCQALEAKLGYTFRDGFFLRNALLHRSHVHVTGQDRERSNERLEFLGDAVLGLVVNEDLYQKFPDRSEGDLTKMKALLVCGARLSEVAGEFKLGVHIRMSRSEAATGGRQRSSILADTTEALIGAVYLDGGLDAARGVIQRLVLSGSEQVLAKRSLRNYKSRLQELIQARHKSPPRYRVLEVDGPDHDRLFKVSVTFSGKPLGQGEGRNKKTAEQNAAREALEALERDPELLDRNRGTLE